MSVARGPVTYPRFQIFKFPVCTWCPFLLPTSEQAYRYFTKQIAITALTIRSWDSTACLTKASALSLPFMPLWPETDQKLVGLVVLGPRTCSSIISIRFLIFERRHFESDPLLGRVSRLFEVPMKHQTDRLLKLEFPN